MQIKVLRATVKDAEEILSLQKLAYQSEAEIYNDYTILPLHETVKDAEQAFETHHIFKAVNEKNEIVGSVRGKHEDGTTNIGKLMVHPSAQNQGLGRKLMNAIEQALPATIYKLFTGSKSEKNLALYQKLGYEIVSHAQLPGEATVFAFLEKRTIS